MGRQTGKIEVCVRVSRHNSQQDKDDDAAVERLKEEIQMMVDADPDYSRVVWSVQGGV